MEDMFWLLASTLTIFCIVILVSIAILKFVDWYKNHKRFKIWKKRLKEELNNKYGRRGK